MSRISRSAASLGFRGTDLDPELITAKLGCPPSAAAAKGGVWRTSQGVEQISRWGFWRREVEPASPGDLDAQVAELLLPLTDDLAIWRQLTQAYQSWVFCGLFLDVANEGLSIKPQTLTMLGERGLRLELDVYGPG